MANDVAYVDFLASEVLLKGHVYSKESARAAWIEINTWSNGYIQNAREEKEGKRGARDGSPIPALQWTNTGWSASDLRRSSSWMRSLHVRKGVQSHLGIPGTFITWADSGTPKSGHFVQWSCVILLTSLPSSGSTSESDDELMVRRWKWAKHNVTLKKRNGHYHYPNFPPTRLHQCRWFPLNLTISSSFEMMSITIIKSKSISTIEFLIIPTTSAAFFWHFLRFPKMHRSNHNVVAALIFSHELDTQLTESKGLSYSGGPVSVGFDAIPLHQICNHDNDLYVWKGQKDKSQYNRTLLPKHSPEITKCMYQRCLTANIGLCWTTILRNERGEDDVWKVTELGKSQTKFALI